MQTCAFDRAMGINAYEGGFIFAGLHQIWRFNLAKQIDSSREPQALLIPHGCTYTGFVNCHDVVQLNNEQVAYIATKFNCLAQTSFTNSLVPVWVPPFFRELVAEDCCHVNGVASTGRRPRFISMLGTGVQKDEWRKDRSQGAIYDLKSNKPVAEHLWMPHSPRVHEQQLYALESGLGSFGLVSDGKINPILMLPGFTRGLDFCGSTAAIGYSCLRPKAQDALPLETRMSQTQTTPHCGVILYDTKEKTNVHSLQFSSTVTEIFDVAFLTGTSNARLIHPSSSEMVKVHSIGLNRLAIRPQ